VYPFVLLMPLLERLFKSFDVTLLGVVSSGLCALDSQQHAHIAL
jgi:hypothetical protein